MPKVAPQAAVKFSNDPVHLLQPREVKSTFVLEFIAAELWGQDPQPCMAAGERTRDRVVAGEIRENNLGPYRAQRHCMNFGFCSICKESMV